MMNYSLAKTTVCLVVFLASTVISLCNNDLHAQDRPNIVFIMVDDMGYGELGVTGQLNRSANGLKHIDTPNIDALANGGLRMTNFYATPICASTRAALMSGYHNGHSPVDRNGGNNGGNAIRDEDITMAETLKSAGYTTGAFGKWGLGGFDHNVAGVNVHNQATAVINFADAIPTNQGFDEFYGYLNQVRAHDFYETFQWEQNGSGGLQTVTTSTSDYSHDLISAKSVDFIASHANESNPFFMYAPFTPPHAAFDPPNDSIRQAYIAAGYTGTEADYAAMMTRVDQSVGDIVNRLKDPDGNGNQSDSVYDDTLIVFTSDNGGTGGENALFGGSGGFRDDKGSVFEGGIRAPLIASWNGRITPGQVDTTVVASVDDLLATFSSLGGAEIPVGVDSADFSGLLTGEQIENRHFHIFEARNASDYAIRMGDWKLVNTGGTSQLYNVTADPDESNNVAGSNAAIVGFLQQIALDEGVQSDAGTGTTQTTNIVQYKSWSSQSALTNWADNNNWAGGTQLNTRGVAANNFSSGPAENWVVQMGNTTGGAQETIVSADSEVLGLLAQGSAGPMNVKIDPGRTLIARNGARIAAGGQIEIDNGSLQTLRTIDVRAGGILRGAGTIAPIYDTTGTPFTLYSIVGNRGRVEIGAGSGTTTTDSEVIGNGGFENGTGNSFNATNNWFNFGGDDTLNARNGTNPNEGAFRGIVGISSTGASVAPAQNTGHLLSSGDEFTLSFDYAGASGWDLGSDQLQVSLYYDNNGADVELFSTILTPTVNFGTAYNNFSTSVPGITDANAFGKDLFVRIESLGGSSEFAAIEGISLELADQVASSDILNLDGNYFQSTAGVLAMGIVGNAKVAGQDFDRFAMTGTAELDGTIELTLGGFDFNRLESIDVLTASGGVSGIFDQVVGINTESNTGLAVLYSANAVSVMEALLGDANLDGMVNDTDLAIWNANKFSTQTTTWISADFNGDGMTDNVDFQLWQTNASSFLLGDVNLDGTVDFLDIAPFITVLSSGGFQAEADCDESGAVDFLDIAPFIAILSGS